ncbi:hypothetical protein NB550_11080 [Vibrio parahaemolyticus]|uniref:hypothetical protein n=1 Tax=Vibrio TaxID=662 RepID=UPI00215CC30E|nr:hypothetical protein [Vibrio parahaemolyticus]MCR9888102.1 hypothetical protein [Vibrio parahaemolyticus]MCR9918032.1 hypothetical protein [Vibrio parahaemolyticus]WHT06077.1 hypothetical protein O2T11_25855 [Vibrio parahaemolyticus]
MTEHRCFFSGLELIKFANMLECDWRGIKYLAGRCGLSAGALRALLKNPDVNSDTFEQLVFVAGYNIEVCDYPTTDVPNEYELFFDVENSSICAGWAYVLDKRTSKKTAQDLIDVMNPDTIEGMTVLVCPERTVALFTTNNKTFIHSYECSWVHYAKLNRLLSNWLVTVPTNRAIYPIDLTGSVKPLVEELLELQRVVPSGHSREYYLLLDELDNAMRNSMCDDLEDVFHEGVAVQGVEHYLNTILSQ